MDQQSQAEGDGDSQHSVREEDAMESSPKGRTLTVAVAPKAKARPRMSKSGHVYTPKDTIAYESYIRDRWNNTHGSHSPYAGAVAVIIRFHFKRPQKDYLRGTLRESAQKYVVKTPDLDNIEKAVLDALNGSAYVDDKQVVRKYTEKLWAHENAVQIEVLPLEE